MSYKYGYGELEDKLINLLRSGTPDFEAAEKLIQQGADVNAVGKYDDENILSEILSGYWQSAYKDIMFDECENCEGNDCDVCENKRNLNPNLGESMCAIIRFFIAHGFDVNKCDGCFGAQCLWALTLSTFDRYMIDATKLLFDAGAKNRSISPTSEDEYETPWSFISAEGSYQGICEHDHSQSNLYEAIYQIYQAIEDGRAYDGIDLYEQAVGKKIQKVLVEKEDEKDIFFSMNLTEFKKENCFTRNLYFVYDGGVLITTQYAEFWTDTILPDKELIDVTEYFEKIKGQEIKGFTFDNKVVEKDRTRYSQPITIIEMESGYKIRFSINFGEVKEDERAAFFEILDTNKNELIVH